MCCSAKRPKEDVQGVGLSGRFGAEGKDHCLLFQLVALLAKGSLVQGAKLPLDLLAAYLDVVGEMVTDIACFWEVAVSP